MVIAGDEALAERMRMVRGQGQSPTRRYWHEVLGFNYRMTNIVAAIGLAQIERLDTILERKRAVAARYQALLRGLPVAFQRPMEGVRSSHWLVSVLLPPGADRDAVQRDMAARGVDTRPVFHCAHEMPMYARGERFPVAEDVAARGLSLPSYPTLADGDLDRVADALCAALRAQGLA
jgi:perosamine synthetase